MFAVKVDAAGWRSGERVGIEQLVVGEEAVLNSGGRCCCSEKSVQESSTAGCLSYRAEFFASGYSGRT